MDATDLIDHQHAKLPELAEQVMVELTAQSRMHARYLDQLLEDGFTRAEAFELVRDHHWWFTAGAIPPDPQRMAAMLPWLTDALKSSESSPSTADVYRLSKVRSTEQ